MDYYLINYQWLNIIPKHFFSPFLIFPTSGLSLITVEHVTFQQFLFKGNPRCRLTNALFSTEKCQLAKSNVSQTNVQLNNFLLPTFQLYISSVHRPCLYGELALQEDWMALQRVGSARQCIAGQSRAGLQNASQDLHKLQFTV